MESEARLALQEYLSLNRNEPHVNVRIEEYGIYIDKELQFLGASPDGLVTCDCCEVRLVEIKCPRIDLSRLSYLKDEKLKHKTSYYGQIQGQMMVTGIHKSYFYIYYGAGKEHFEILEYDETFCKDMRANLTKF